MHDLADIYEYICEDNERAALPVLDSIFRQTDLLAESPGLGRSRGHGIRKGGRSLPIGKYALFYRLSVEGIEVLRVLHGARDLPPLLE